jgi:hypothetical protein
MGLAISVGMLADLAQGEGDDPKFLGFFPLNQQDESSSFRRQLRALNKALVRAGLSKHDEPASLAPGDKFSCSMWGYSGLHHLRRIAAWDALERGLPSPGDDSSASDPIVDEYNVQALDAARFPYRHLMLHSDCEGYYVPQDFVPVIFPDDSLRIPGGMIGSVQQLLLECTRLAEILSLPLDVDPESDDVLNAMENQGGADHGWQRYGVESFSCLQLVNACKASLRSGALMVFC